jgi:hypothetical protein
LNRQQFLNITYDSWRSAWERGKFPVKEPVESDNRSAGFAYRDVGKGREQERKLCLQAQAKLALPLLQDLYKDKHRLVTEQRQLGHSRQNLAGTCV